VISKLKSQSYSELTAPLISPSILSADFANLEKEIKALASAGADWVHVDVMDGLFVPNITIGIPVVESLKKVSPLPLDVHLMIDRPERFVEDFIKAGSDYLTVHVESTAEPLALLKKIRRLGAKPGITLRPGTSLATLVECLPEVDLVLVMTVEPGFGGQSFMADQVAKISELKRLREKNHWHYLIEVDGGINNKTVHHCVDADVLVAGSYIFKNNYGDAIDLLKSRPTAK
jgi:ribulose-phosphate 3-epimerase